MIDLDISSNDDRPIELIDHPPAPDRLEAWPDLEVTAMDVRNCLADTGPIMHYQPIVHLESEIVIGAEAFSRFDSNAPIAHWFLAAQRAGLGTELELRAVDNILDDRAAWSERWEMVCVNVSPDRLLDDDICAALTDRGDNKLVVELTGQSALPVDGVLRRRLEELRDQGVRIAVSGARADDDSSRRISRIQPQVVKLDAGLIERVADDPQCRTFVSELIPRCHREGIFVVAVGIEAPEQLGFVRSLGIEAAQGHLFGSATPLGGSDHRAGHVAER